MNKEQISAALKRIQEIDSSFESASGWGSWMIMCANEREALVNELQKATIQIEHRFQARLSDGSRTS